MEATEPQTLEQMAEGLLIPDEVPAEQPETEMTDEPEVQDEPEAEADAEDTAEDADTEEDEADEADAEPSEDEDEGEQDADAQPEMFTVKVDGQDVEVTRDELLRGYAGQAYIQKGMTEAAELRKQTEAAFNALSEQRTQLETLLTDLQQTGIQPPQAPDIAELQSDPIGYMEKKAIFDQQQAEYSQRMALVNQQRQQAEAAANQARMAHQQEQLTILAERIPDFADPEKGAALQRRLVQTGEGYGFTKDEIAAITDARHVQVLHDAMAYRELQATKKDVTAKAAKARPVVKAKAKKAQNPASEARKKQAQKFRQTGRIEDAVDLILNPQGA